MTKIQQLPSGILPVEGWPNYFVDPARGLVYSQNKYRLHTVGKLSNGYVYITLCDGPRRRLVYAHQLIAEAVYGPHPGLEVNHINGIKNDNRIENLEYVNRNEQMCHSQSVLRDRIPGVCKLKNRDLYHPIVTHKGTKYSAGFHKTPEEAQAAFIRKTQELGIANRYV